MARDVLLRKLAYLRQLLRDLTPFAPMSRNEIEKQHYTVERILELLVGAAADLTFHILAERGLTPTSYRESFRLAAQEGLLPGDLAERLQQAAGMHNILVNLYETIDYAVLHASIAPALHDFALFVAVAEQWETSEEHERSAEDMTQAQAFCTRGCNQHDYAIHASHNATPRCDHHRTGVLPR
jgi:Uncharacterized conserved protein, COG2445